MADRLLIRRDPHGHALKNDVDKATAVIATWGISTTLPTGNTEDRIRSVVARHASRYGRVSTSIDDLAELEAILNGRFCGVADPVDGDIKLLTYGATHGRRGKVVLTYTVNSTSSGMNPVNVNNTIRGAFNAWQMACPKLSFSQISANGDLNIAFGGWLFDSRFGQAGGTAGAGQYPTDGNNIFLDSAEPWTAALLGKVILHEIGHALGLSHSTDKNSLMYPYALNGAPSTIPPPIRCPSPPSSSISASPGSHNRRPRTTPGGLVPAAALRDPCARRRARHPRTAGKHPYGEAQPLHLSIGPVASTP